jgi:hypothetical protein
MVRQFKLIVQLKLIVSPRRCTDSDAPTCPNIALIFINAHSAKIFLSTTILIMRQRRILHIDRINGGQVTYKTVTHPLRNLTAQNIHLFGQLSHRYLGNHAAMGLWISATEKSNRCRKWTISIPTTLTNILWHLREHRWYLPCDLRP